MVASESSGKAGLKELSEGVYDQVVQATGQQPTTAIFDKSALVPLSELPEMVRHETGVILPDEGLPHLMTDGWVPQLALETTGEPGFALYVPSRIGLLLELEGRGYGPRELRAIAAYEEEYIDNVLVNDETPYLDDDRKLVLNELKVRLADAHDDLTRVHQHPKGRDGYRSPLELESEIAGLGRLCVSLEAESLETMSQALREKTSRLAFTVRLMHEMIRVQLLNQHHAQVRSGYSPWLVFRRASYPVGKPALFEGVFWDASLGPWAFEEAVPLRLPDFRIEGDQVTLTRPLRPAEYLERWKRYALDDYFTTHARLAGERKCAYCHAKLPAEAHERRRYCSEAHKKDAKMQRWRHRSKPTRTRSVTLSVDA
jgi:hypothetical protein